MPSDRHPPAVLDREQSREVDRLAHERYGIPGVVLMENAARGLLEAAVSMLEGVVRPRVLVACGRGNNGGDGYALARLLDERGIDVEIIACGPCRPGSDAAINAAICAAMNVPHAASVPEAPVTADLVVDAIFGTGLDRAIAGTSALLVERLNDSGRPILAADVPSGLDCDSGHPVGGGPCIRATRTVTFVALKPGFLVPGSSTFTGDVAVASIGVPRALLPRTG